MMRWSEPLNNIHHLAKRINKKDRVYVHNADLLDLSSINNIMGEVQPDYIFHLTAQSFPKTSFNIPIETLQTNIIGTANLLESIKQLHKRNNFDPIVHICSSSEVYGKQANNSKPLNENTNFHGASPYSISKIGTDFLGRFYGEAYGIKTFVTKGWELTPGPRRSDVFFESTLAKQIALIEYGYQEPIIKLGNLDSETFQDTRDAVRSLFYYQRNGKGTICTQEKYSI